MTNLLKQKEMLKEVFKEVILEVMHEERINFYDSIFPNASKDESEEVGHDYGSPLDYKAEEFHDMTDWIIDAH